MKIAIYGAGAMGTVLGALLTRAGKQIDLITRNEEHVKALKANGARIIVKGRDDIIVPVAAYTPEEMQDGYDVILLMTKQRDNPSICEFLLGKLKEDGAICTMQNGLPEFAVANVIGADRTLGCAVSWGATFIGEGASALTSDPDSMTFALGAYGNSGRHLSMIEDYLSAVGKVEVVADFMGARWAKLAVNSAFSSISAITGLTFGEVASRKDTRPIVLALLNEAFAVAESCGVTLGKIQGHDIQKIYKCKGGIKKFFALRMLPLAMKKHADLVSGMYFDLREHKKSDIDYINGVIAHSARNFGVDIPVNTRVIALAHEIERGVKDPSPDNLKLLV